MADDAPQQGDNAEVEVPRQLRLDELRSRLDEAQAKAEEARISSEALVGDIAALQSASDDANQAIDNYRGVRTQLERQKADLEEALQPDRDVVGTPDNAARHDQERQRLDAELQALRDGLPAADQALADARAIHDKARAEAERAGKNFQDVKDRPNMLAAQLQGADALRAQISAVAKSDPPRAYVLLQAVDLQLGEAEIKSVDAYQQELDDAWGALAEKQKGLRDAASAETVAKATLDQQNAKLERQHLAYVDLILQRAQMPTTGEGGAVPGEGGAAGVGGATAGEGAPLTQGQAGASTEASSDAMQGQGGTPQGQGAAPAGQVGATQYSGGSPVTQGGAAQGAVAEAQSHTG